LDLAVDRLGRLSTVTQTRSGRRLVLAYDRESRLASVSLERPSLLVLGLEYDARGRLVGVSDSLGTKARYEYDDEGRMLADVRRGGASFIFRYGVDGRCVYVSGTDRFEERRLAYDLAGRTTRVTDSHGHVTRYLYNPGGQIVEMESPTGLLSQYAFDDDGRATKSVERDKIKGELAYDELGRIKSAAAPDGRKLELAYDDDHQLTRFTNLDGKSWSYRFEHHRLVESTNPLGHRWRYETNEHGELVHLRNPLGDAERYGWDAEGNLAWFSGPNQAAWYYRYNELGQRTEVRDPAGNVERRSYDTSGNLIESRRPDGSLWRVEYDAAGRPSRWLLPDGTSAAARYNACGQLIERIEPDRSVKRFVWDTEPARILAVEDGVGKRIEYEYDPEGRPSLRRHWDGSELRLEHDSVGSLTAITLPDGGRFTFEYDVSARLTKRTDSDGVVTEYVYDDAGRVVGAKNGASEVTFERDLYGRILKETQDGLAVEHGYDLVGRATRLQGPAGPEILTEWTAGGSCSSVSIGSLRVAFAHDELGRETGRALPGGGQILQAYDPVGRLTDQAYQPPRQQGGGTSAPAGFARHYDYDLAGRMTDAIDAERGRLHYLHDPVGRLCAVQRGDASASFYDFDAADNRALKAEAPAGTAVPIDQVRAPNARSGLRFDAGRLEAAGCDVEVAKLDRGNGIAEVVGPNRRTSYHHDARGRLVKKEVFVLDQPTRTWLYHWNGSGTLSSVVTPEGARWTYAYDALGRRASRRGPTGETRYVWTRNRLLHVLVEGRAPRTNVFHPERAPVLAHQRDGEVFFPLTDQTGAISKVVDEGGAIVRRNENGPWGETPPGAPPPEGEDGFAGQIYDPESGLYYNVHRYYDPELGRFISPDPIGLLGGFNEYAFVPSPLHWLDVDGLVPTGGPFPYLGSSDNGRPNFRSGDRTDRQVTNPDTGRPNTVRAPGDGATPDSGGKTLAVMQGPDGGSNAFVSGHGDSSAQDYPPGWGVEQNPQFGNWCHAEMHAMLDLHNNPNAAPGDYNLYIDRPPCDECSQSLSAAMQELAARDINVTVHYQESDEETDELRWMTRSC
ncbi:MAG TPA: RHS repeat-associated core domain-containing protein, partial [Polyangia bacterium]|nr:RHS repeat-associated core domain-containing protein [Polyangia bacterium]